jgi:ribosome recycling factor
MRGDFNEHLCHLNHNLINMRGNIIARSVYIAFRRPAPTTGLARAAVASPSIRSISTSSPLLKKSKAAATKKSHKAAKEESNGNPEGSRYEKAPENNLNDVLEKTERRMEKAVDWAKGTVFDMVERGRGRVSPGESLFGILMTPISVLSVSPSNVSVLLDSVKVTTPDVPGSRSLNNVASVTVKGTALMVNIWDTEVGLFSILLDSSTS